MDSSKIDALRFYQMEGLDEILFDEPVDRFKQVVKETKEETKQAKQEKPSNENVKFIKPQDAIKKDSVGIGSVSKPVSNVSNGNGAVNLNKPSSTFDAISSLAKRNNTNSNKKFMSIDEIVAKAKKSAQDAKDLVELRKAVEDFDGCSLKKMATNTVFCDGNAESKVMVIGEAPGNHEDLQGIPFCGDSGKLLDAMFESINMKRADDYYITNVIFWRPPGNRRPTDEELAICRPFVERHIQLVDPKIIILVGGTAISAILGMSGAVTKIRGKVIDFEPEFMDRKIDSFAVFHPSYLMRQSSNKRIAWRDFLKLEQVLKS